MSSTQQPSQGGKPQIPSSKSPVNAKDRVAGSITTLDIKSNSSISSKVKQCLAILRPENANPSGNTTAPEKRQRKSKVVALRAVHPSAGSKAISIVEIVKRYIADKDGETEKGTWWQYTKLESELIEWPPKKAQKKKKEVVLEKPEGSAVQNTNKRKQDITDDRAAKKPKLDGISQGTATQSEILDTKNTGSRPVTTDKISLGANSKRRKIRTDGAGDISDEDEYMDEIPAHLQDSTPIRHDGIRPSSASSSGKPRHLRDSSPGLQSDDRPVHLRDTSPVVDFKSDDVPPHLRDSSPATPKLSRIERSPIRKPAHLLSTSPIIDPESDDMPPHMRESSPATPRPSQIPSSPIGVPAHLEDSSPIAVLVEPTTGVAPQKNILPSSPLLASRQPYVESDDEKSEAPMAPETPNVEHRESEGSEDEYRQFSYLDIDKLPERHTKKLLAELDEAERNRKKYRSIAIMTIFLSLEKRGDLEKLYGYQTNFQEAI